MTRTIAALALLAAPALAQEDVAVLTDWDSQGLYEAGWSVEMLIDESEVVGPDGEEIGEVENVLFSEEGAMLAIVAEVGGFWDINDTHVSVPAGEVEFGATLAQIAIPVNQENVGAYPSFGAWGDDAPGAIAAEEVDEAGAVGEDLATGPDVFKATDLIGDYAYLDDDIRYGYINDIIVRDGRIAAVVVDTALFGSPGYSAYPYYPDTEPDAGADGLRYDIPLGADQIAEIENFEYDRLQSRLVE